MITLERSIELEPGLKEIQNWVTDNLVSYDDESEGQEDWMEFYSEFKDKVGDLVGWYRPHNKRDGELKALATSEVWNMWIEWFLKVTGY